jgi:hypothetical protein
MNAMRHAARLVAVVGFLAVIPAFGQDVMDRTVDQYKCRDVMRENGANRDIAVAFLHGFLLGKSGNQRFNLDTLHQQTEEFVELCLNNPDSRAVEQMTAVKKQ